MKTKSTQQEVLLITGTRFSSRQCQDKKDAGNPNRLTDNEMLEDACWNGLIQSLLPEVFDTTECRQTLSLENKGGRCIY